MERLIGLIEKRKEVGKRPAPMKGGDLKDLMECSRLEHLISEEVIRLYDEGKLN